MIDHLNPEHWNKPLWCVYGPKHELKILCCKLNHSNDTLNIWGYSIYKREQGFRTLGIAVSDWIGRHEVCRFYADRDAAIAVQGGGE